MQQQTFEDLAPRQHAEPLSFRRLHELRLGEGAPATAEELAACAAAKEHVREQLAPIAPMFSQISARLQAQLAPLAPVVAEIAAKTRRLDDDLLVRARTTAATSQTPIAHRRGASRERHARRGSSRGSSSSDGSDPEPPLARPLTLREEPSA